MYDDTRRAVCAIVKFYADMLNERFLLFTIYRSIYALMKVKQMPANEYVVLNKPKHNS